MKFTKKAVQKGFTIIELMIVLAIISILIGGVIVGLQMMDDTKASSAARDSSVSITALKLKYRNIGTTAAVTTTNAIAGNVFPSSMDWVAGGTTVNNQAGGAVTVVPATIVSANDAFLLSEDGFKSSQCQKYIGSIFPNVKKIVVTPTGGAATTVYSTYGTVVALSPPTIDAACSGSSNLIAMTFAKN